MFSRGFVLKKKDLYKSVNVMLTFIDSLNVPYFIPVYYLCMVNFDFDATIVEIMSKFIFSNRIL